MKLNFVEKIIKESNGFLQLATSKKTCETLIIKPRDAKRTSYIENLRRNLDYDTLEAHIDYEDKWERAKLSSTLSELSRKKTGTDFYSEDSKKEIGWMKQIYDRWKGTILVHKKLGATPPKKILIDKIEGSGSGAFSKYFQEITLSNTLFENTEKLSDKAFNSIDSVLFHEITHSRHFNENWESYRILDQKGFDAILPENSKKVMFEFKSMYKDNHKSFADLGWSYSEDIFETNLKSDQYKTKEYHLTLIPKVIDDFIQFSSSENFPNDLKTNAFKEQLKKLDLAKYSYIKLIKFIKAQNLGNYAMCNPLETIAVAKQAEFDGVPLSKQFRNFLDKLGAPKTVHISYLPEDHPVIKKIEKREKLHLDRSTNT